MTTKSYFTKVNPDFGPKVRDLIDTVQAPQIVQICKEHGASNLQEYHRAFQQLVHGYYPDCPRSKIAEMRREIDKIISPGRPPAEREKALKILAKSIYKELKSQGCDNRLIIGFATEIIGCITNELASAPSKEK